jgi:PKD repeat protein
VTFANNYILEIRFAGNVTSAGFYAQIGYWNGGSGYIIADWVSDGTPGFCKLYTGSLNATSVGFDSGTYHTYELGRPGTSATLNRDGGAVTTNAGVATTAYPISFRVFPAGGGGSVTVDYIALRPYIATEPTFTRVSGGLNPWSLAVRRFKAIVPPVIAPVADFSADVTSGTAPLTVQFTDLSTNAPTSWDWDYGDGSAHGTMQNPSHQYAAGTFAVTLAATNAAGSDGETKTNYITVTPATVAADLAGPYGIAIAAEDIEALYTIAVPLTASDLTALYNNSAPQGPTANFTVDVTRNSSVVPCV